MSQRNKRPTLQELRMFAGILIPFSFFLGWVIRAQFGGVNLGWGVNGLLLVLGLIGVISPQSIGWFFHAWNTAFFPVGWLVSSIVLSIVFFSLVTPIGLIARFCGHDPLELRPVDSPSYWKPLEADIETARYFRQF